MFSSRRGVRSWSDVRVGIFIVVGLVIIVLGILFFQPGKHLGATIKVRTVFASVQGLIPGAAVMMSGVQVGTVSRIDSIEPQEIPTNQPILKRLQETKQRMSALNSKDPAQADKYQHLQEAYTADQARLKHVVVLMDVVAAQQRFIKADSIASLRSRGLVGEKYVDISTATPEAPILSPVSDALGVRALEIPSQESPDIDAILENASSATSAMENIMAELDQDIKQGKGTLGKLIKDSSVHDNLNQTLRASAQATRYTSTLLKSIQEGRGTVGKMFTDPALYNTTSDVMREIQKGRGTMGLLINDPSVYEHANAMMKNADQLVTSMNEGRGTITRLVRDPSLYQNSTSAFQEMSSLLQSVNEGKGSLGKFAQDEHFYSNASQAMAGLASVTEKIDKGEGSLGLLAKDKRLYENMASLSGEMLELIRDFRKNPRKYLTIHLNIIKLF